MTKKRSSINKMIDRSSLGAPTVRKLRARTTVHQRSQILRKASVRSARESKGHVTKSNRK